jgi:CTP synthase
MIFLEALRQMKFLYTATDMIFIHLSLVPVLGVVGEQKTKPTQHSVKELRSVGISPDMIICRASEPLDTSTKNKLSIFCQIQASHVLSVHDVSNIYHVPLILTEQGVHTIIKQHLNISDTLMSSEPNFLLWTNMATIVDEIESYDASSVSPPPMEPTPGSLTPILLPAYPLSISLLLRL